MWHWYHSSLPQFPHLCHGKYFQIQCVAYFINDDEVAYGSNKHKLEYNPIFLNQIISLWPVRQH